MNFNGLWIGGLTFLLIGLFHIIVIKAEYYFTSRIWWLFLVLGSTFLLTGVFTKNNQVSIICSILGICFLWSIKELFEQEKRVEKGWFPKRENVTKIKQDLKETK